MKQQQAELQRLLEERGAKLPELKASPSSVRGMLGELCVVEQSDLLLCTCAVHAGTGSSCMYCMHHIFVRAPQSALGVRTIAHSQAFRTHTAVHSLPQLHLTPVLFACRHVCSGRLGRRVRSPAAAPSCWARCATRTASCRCAGCGRLGSAVFASPHRVPLLLFQPGMHAG